jgi:cyclophilin family peptidyl-prolyl cis-trans isomerase
MSKRAQWIFVGCFTVLCGCGLWIAVSQKNANDKLPEVQSDLSLSPVSEASGSGSSDIQTATPSSTVSFLSPTKEPMKTFTQAPAMSISKEKTYIATMKTTKGSMVIALNPKETPVTVNNFVFLAREGYYDNTIFHRILSGFMIQGGDPTGTGRGNPGYQFNDEPVTRDYTRGTIAMANAGANTNGSQFFIMHANYPLPKQYVIFGAIDSNDSESLKTLDALASTKVTMSDSGEQSKPVEPPQILSVSIEER